MGGASHQPAAGFLFAPAGLSVGASLFMKKNLSWWVLGLLAIFFSFVMAIVGGVIGDTLRILVALLWIFAVIDLIRVLVNKVKKHE